MYKAKVYITLKEQVLDPQGIAVTESFNRLGYEGVKETRVGKYVEIFFKNGRKPQPAEIETMCQKLLANPVIEDYRFEIEEVVRA